VEPDHGVHLDRYRTRVANHEGIAEPSQMIGTRVSFALLVAVTTSGCGLLSGTAAPEACGFPDGTVLDFAGRSTTSALGIVEVADDPILSLEPADIYITRDQLTQGDLQGRLVCAIYVTQSGFVEVTVHPDDLPPVAEEPPPPAPRPADGMSRQEAMEVALDEAPEADEAWVVAVAEAGPAPDMIFDIDSTDWARDLPREQWVWRVFLISGDQGRDVFIDYENGNVLGVTSSIVN
jgi:hypothetical protein